MPATPILGFLTVIADNHAYQGGYLVTNSWGRPLEFRVSSAVAPSRVQQIVYGETLRPFIYADLIGRTLFEKTATVADVVFTDSEPALDLRRHIAKPVAWLASVDQQQLLCHADFARDSEGVRELVATLPASLILTEPFGRIRDALAEARKMGAFHRAA